MLVLLLLLRGRGAIPLYQSVTQPWPEISGTKKGLSFEEMKTIWNVHQMVGDGFCIIFAFLSPVMSDL